MSARKQLFSQERTPQKRGPSASQQLQGVTPARCSPLDETVDEEEYNLSPETTTVRRPPRLAVTPAAAVVGCSSTQTSQQKEVVNDAPSTAAGMFVKPVGTSSTVKHARPLDSMAMIEPSPIPKKPRVDDVLRAAVSGPGKATDRTARLVAPQPMAPLLPATNDHIRTAAPPRPAAPLSHQGLSTDVTPQTAIRATQQTQQTNDDFDESSHYTTPVATQLFEPDEPLTATQEAFVVDGFELPSPPPFFPPSGSQDRATTPSSATRRRMHEDTKSTQQCLVQWAESTKAFFDYIDRRPIIEDDAST